MDEKNNVNRKEADEVQKDNEKPQKSAVREILEWVVCIAAAIAIALFLKSYVVFVSDVDGASMENTLHDGERLITWKLGYNPEIGDVVIFEPKTSTEERRAYYVKRVIATEHQTVRIDYSENAVYVDDEKIDEPYIKEEMMTPNWGYEGTVVVPEGHVFVMGDNRNKSVDSRNSVMVGCVDEDAIMGKAVFRFWPLNKIGTVK